MYVTPSLVLYAAAADAIQGAAFFHWDNDIHECGQPMPTGQWDLSCMGEDEW